MNNRLNSLVLSTALAALLAPAALAQDNMFQRGRYTAVTDRAQPEFDPLPMRAGGFDVNAVLGLSAEYNDNVFAASTNEISDTIIRVQPSLEARSHWSSNELNAGVAVDHREFLNQGSETTTDYNAFVGGRLDVTREFQFTGRTFVAHVTEPRYEPASSGAAKPAESETYGASVGATWRHDRVQLDASVGSNTYDFNTLFNYRDMTETFAFARGSYAVSPDVAVFVQGRTADQNYDLPGTTLNPNRDGKLSSIQVGTSFELAAPFRGEIAIGTNQDNKKVGADINGLDLSANMQWFPSQLTTVTFRGARNVFDPGIINVSTGTATRYGVRIDHELLRNVVLYGDAGLGQYDFKGIDRKDKFTDVALGLGYKLNRNARLEASYRFHHQDSSGLKADRNLDQNIIGVGLRIFP